MTIKHININNWYYNYNKISLKMEDTKIKIFESFALISILMPYYGQAHKGFLLLSELNKASRNKIDEYYSEFCRIMSNYSKYIGIYQK